MFLLAALLAVLLVVLAGVHVANSRRHGRTSFLLLSLGSVSTSWLTTHRGEQQ
jgi:uncharacterized membrane protein